MSNLVKNGYFTNPSISPFKYLSTITLVDWVGTFGILARNADFTATTLPTGIIQFYVMQLGGPGTVAGIYQDITFPSIGNGLLSFWISKRANYANLYQSITVSIGSSSGTYNTQDWLWYYKTIPFTISGSDSLTQRLSLSSSTTVTADQSVYISGITITYTQAESIQVNPLLLNSTAAQLYDAVLMTDKTPSVDTTNTKIGSASLAFTATDGDYAQINDFRVPTTGLTITCWFKVSSTGSSRVFDFGNGQTLDNIAYSPNTGTLYYIGTTAYNVGAGSGKADNTWHHMAWTMTFAQPNSQTSIHTVYIDGIATYTNATQFYPTVGSRTNSYLGRSSGASDYLTGNLDDFRIYDRPLSATETMALYSTTSTSVIGTVSYDLTKYYSFENNSLSGTNLGNLASGNWVYDAVLYNGASLTSTAGNFKVGSSALSLTAASSQYAQIQNFSVTNKGLTIACWFKYTSTAWSRLFDFGNGESTDNIFYSPNSGTAYYIGSTGYAPLAASGKADNTWHHFVWSMTYASSNTSTHTVYIDNSLNNTSTTQYYPTLGARTTCYIGRSNWASDPYATGFVDDFRIYNNALTAADVSNLFNSTNSISNASGNYRSGLYNMSTGTAVYDASLNGGAYINNSSLYQQALSLDTSGQYVRLNNALTTSNGLSFAFWARGNNGCGQCTLLDYSNGTGGNHRISLGLQSNTLLGQVVNGSTVGTVSFTTSAVQQELVANGSMALTNITVPTSTGTTPTSWTRVGTGGMADLYEGGYGLMFNGSTQYGYLASATSYAYATGTVECRFRTTFDTSSGAAQGLVTKQFAYGLYVQNNVLWTWSFGNSAGIGSTALVNDGQWHHAALVLNGAASKLYLDGALVGTFTLTVSNQSVAVQIGWGNFGAYFNGSISEVRIWSTALSDAAILIQYNKPTAVESVVLPTGLTGYWSFNEGTGTTVANSVAVLPFTLTGSPTWIRVGGDYSLTFNGSSQYGALTATTSYAYGTGTIECWFRTTANSAGLTQGLVVKPNAYSLFVSSNVLYAFSWGGSTGIASTVLVNDGQWHHAALVFQSGTTDGTKLFLDGVPVGTFTLSVASQTYVLKIGSGTGAAGGQLFNGTLDEVRVWDIALSDAAILSNYNSITVSPTSSGLTGYWKLDEGVGATANNSISAQPSFTLTASPTWTLSTLTSGYSLYQYSLYQKSGLPSTLQQIAYMNNILSTLSQTVTFPAIGNYVLTFYTANISTVFTVGSTLLVTVGAISSTTISYTVNDTWTQYSIPLSITASGSQVVTFKVNTGAKTQLWLTGVSISSLNSVTLNLVPSSAMGLDYASSVNRTVYTDYAAGLILFINNTTKVNTQVGTTYLNARDVRITSDGSRIVWTCSLGYSYFATWNGTTYNNIQTLNPASGTKNFQGMDMTDDGRIAVFSVSGSVPLWAYWTGSGYSAYQQTLNTTPNATYTCAAIAPDGSRIAYVDGTNVYYATWNGTNYTDRITAGAFSGSRMVRFSKDGNILFVVGNNATFSLQYYVWTNSSVYTLYSSNASVFGVNFDTYGLAVDYNNNLYATKTATGVYKSTFKASNQYTQTNFYNAQNLNDNVWRHIAWTIDLSNSTYKYYINGELIKTDISAAYAFPAPTTRTNNLLGTSTDLSLSYFTGGIDDYRVYGGVLTDAKVYSLFSDSNTDYTNNNNQSLIQSYTFDMSSYSGTDLGNSSSGSYVYDASLNGGATIAKRVATGALSLDATGQHVKINSSLTTTSAGLSFSFWARANNGCGINTLLDYSNGPGGNQKITYALLNNQPYTQVVNGTTVGTVSILTDSFSKSHTGSINGLTFSANHQIMVVSASNGVYFSTYSNGTWSAFTTVISTTYTRSDIAITSDGTKIVWVGSNCYYATWSNASQNFIGITQTLDVTVRNYITFGMTGDGSRIVTAVYGGYVYTANWTGANYTAFTQISDSNVRNYNAISLTLDGSRLFLGAVTTDNQLYYSVWNTTIGNYDTTVLAATVVTGNSNWIRRVKCSPDGNVVIISSYGASAGVPKIACYIYNGTSYIAQTSYVYGSSVDLWAMSVVVDGSSNYIYLAYYTAITRFRYTVSNQYSQNNFYPNQNLNDNVWRHYAWTINPATYTYKYYLNGNIIATDTSANYVFPAATARTTNLLGVGKDLSLSYFKGGIDDYRVYSTVLTDSQISQIYTTGTYDITGDVKSRFKSYTKGIQIKNDVNVGGDDTMDVLQPYSSGIKASATGVYVMRGGVLTDMCQLYQPVSSVSNVFVFTYTGADQTFVVPTSVVQIECWGAGGGTQCGIGITQGYHTGSGGGGGYTKALFYTSVGMSLTVIVGQGGKTGTATTLSNTYGGGGGQVAQDAFWGQASGGGRSAVRITSGATEIITAGGGGGAGLLQWPSFIATLGANAGSGGGGGGLVGGDALNSYGGEGGKGGTQSAGGATATSGGGTAGSQYTGGVGNYGAGGGGGYYGGGSGGAIANTLFGGGGGGSSYISSGYLYSVNTTMVQASAPTVANGSGVPSAYTNTIGNGGAASNTYGSGAIGQNGLVVITCLY